ncbi:MAG: hypothetical protein ABI417_00245 [Coleofasciculaceae cyanobacterium]
MGTTWEVKSSWLGGANTHPGRVRCFYLVADNISAFWVFVRLGWGALCDRGVCAIGLGGCTC